MGEMSFQAKLAVNAARAAVKMSREANLPIGRVFPSKAELAKMPKAQRDKILQARTLGIIAKNLEETEHSRS